MEVKDIREKSIAGTAKDNKEEFLKYIISKRKSRSCRRKATYFSGANARVVQAAPKTERSLHY